MQRRHRWIIPSSLLSAISLAVFAAWIEDGAKPDSLDANWVRPAAPEAIRGAPASELADSATAEAARLPAGAGTARGANRKGVRAGGAVAPLQSKDAGPSGTLTREQRLEAIQKSTELFEQSEKLGLQAQYIWGHAVALHSIAAILDSQNRGEETRGEKVHMNELSPGEIRFVSGGKLYVFQEEEFPGFSRLNDAGAALTEPDAGGEAATAAFPQDLKVTVNDWSTRALEILTR